VANRLMDRNPVSHKVDAVQFDAHAGLIRSRRAVRLGGGVCGCHEDLVLQRLKRIPLCHPGRVDVVPSDLNAPFVVNVSCVYGSRAVAVHLRDNSAIAGYGNGFADVPGLTLECFFACAINSRTLSLPA